MNSIQFVATQDRSSFGELVMHCEIRAIASRIISAVRSVFQAIAQTIDRNIVQPIRQRIAAVQERRAVLVHAQPIINQALTHIQHYQRDSVRESIIRAIAEIPAQERRAVLAYAHSLLDDFTNKVWGHSGTMGAGEVIRAAARVRVEERELFFPLLRRYISNECTLELATRVEEVNNLRAIDKEGIIRNALMITDPNVQYLHKIINTLATIPPDQRDLVSTLTHQLSRNRFDYGTIIHAVIDIPADERNDVIQHALQLITPGMYKRDKEMIIDLVAAQPADRRAEFVRNRLAGVHHPAPEQGINVHEGDRDQRVGAAVQLLYQRQGNIPRPTTNQAADAFIAYLDDSQLNPADKKLARDALLRPLAEGDNFGPLIEEADFILSGFQVSGKDLIGRLWIFASQLDQSEQDNVKLGMISALKDSYDAWGRVCNEGKTQRLVLATLQGRLKEVNIETILDQVSRTKAMQMFFEVNNGAHRGINTKANLIQAANQFCDGNSGVNRQEFLEDINTYATEQEMTET